MAQYCQFYCYIHCVAVILNCLCTVTVLSRMLYAFVSHCRSSEECAGTHITVTYIVSGFVGGSGNKVCRIFSCYYNLFTKLNLRVENGSSFNNVLCAPYINPVIPNYVVSVFPQQEHQVYVVDEDSLEGVA